MNLRKSTTLFITLSIVLACLLLILGVFTYKDYQSGIAVVGELEKEKTAIKNELSELIVKYDSVKFDNIQMKRILQDTKERLEALNKKLDLDKAPGVRSLLRYRKEVEILKAEKFRLLHLNDSLLTINVEIKDSLSQSNMALNQANDLTAILREENIRLASIVNDNKNIIDKFGTKYAISINRIESEALRVRSSGKKFLTDKAKKAEQVRVCFSVVSENKSIENLVMFLKVKNPEGALIGVPVNVTTVQGAIVSYSDKKDIEYVEKEGKACFIVEVTKKEMMAGTYKTELYYNHKKVGSSEFELF